MSKAGLVLFLILMSGSNYAQDYFVLIQADNRQSFYVRLGSQVYSSSPEGHLILSQLKDSTYTITIGMPGQAARERHYTLSIQQKDQEFRLKDQGDGGWGLYDEQTHEIRVPELPAGGGEQARPLGIKKDDAFSRLMAGVVHDTAVMYNTYAMEKILLDSPAIAKTTPAKASVTNPPPGRTDSAAGGPDSPTIRPSTTATLLVPTSDTSRAANKPAVIFSDTKRDTASLTKSDSDKPVTPYTSINTNIPAKDSSVALYSPLTPNSPKDTSTLYRPLASGSSISGSPEDSTAVPRLASNSPKDSIITTRLVSSNFSKDSTTRRPRGVVKLSERKLPRSLRLAFADRSAGKVADTIILFIPVDTPVVAKDIRRPGRSVDTTRVPALRGHGPNPDSPILGQGQNPVSRPIPGAQLAEGPHSRPADTPRKTAPTTRSSLPFVNSDCHSYATDYDVDKLRVKMLESIKDDDRILSARKVFRTRCFTTRQIRALSEVFTSDASKFHFFETAYPFCSDDQFRELASLLADPVYNSKFRAMTDHQ